MELRHLIYFKTVAEELHFRKAAEKLFISQPPLSRQIKELEEELGSELFIRNNKSVSLTEAGKYFKEKTDEILTLLETAKNKTKDIHHSLSGEFRIGFISSTFQNHLISALKDLQNLYPNLHAKVYEVPSSKQIAALETGKLDIGIVRSPVMSTKLTIHFLFRDEFILVGNHFLKLSAAELKEKSFIFFNREYAPVFHQKLTEICHLIGFKPKILHEANNIHAITNLIKQNLGISILPKSIQSQYPELCYTELNMPGIFTEVVMVYPKNQQHPALNPFMDIYLKLMKPPERKGQK